MKTILVDAIHCFASDMGEIFEEMRTLLDSYPNTKILLTGANDEEFKKFGLNNMPYEVFSLKHYPEKTDPEYYKQMLEKFELNKDQVLYFEHSQEALESAKSVGIISYYYDDKERDLDKLKSFLDESL